MKEQLDINNQQNTVTVQESELRTLIEDQLDDKDFEKGIEFMLNEMGLNEPEELKILAGKGLEI